MPLVFTLQRLAVSQLAKESLVTIMQLSKSGLSERFDKGGKDREYQPR